MKPAMHRTAVCRFAVTHKAGMRFTGFGALAAIFVVAFFVLEILAPEPVAAKPKKVQLNGCTAEQIQAPSSGACINQLEQDTASGAAYPHALFCDASGVYCCQSDGSRTFGCKKVSGLIRPPNQSPIDKVPGALQVAPQ